MKILFLHSVSELDIRSKQETEIPRSRLGRQTEQKNEWVALNRNTKWETEICKPETEICKQETEICKPETEICKPETEICKLETEICKQKTEISKQETEISAPRIKYLTTEPK
jgi:hypothetical protein